MTDRFELEQKIMKVFEIIEDVKLVNSYIEDPRLEALATLWEIKIEDLWQTFEEYVRDEVGKREKATVIEEDKNADYVFVCKHCGDKLGIKWAEDTIGEVRLNTRKPLSDDEIEALAHECNLIDDYPHKFARAIEAKHGIGENDE